MENTLTIFVETLTEHWDMPDELALKWNEYEKEHPIDPANQNADSVHQAWFDTLTDEDKSKISRRKAEE